MHAEAESFSPLYSQLMPRMQLSMMQLGMIVGAYLMCHNIKLISRTLKLPYSTVYRWISRYEQSRSVERSFGSGRPQKTSPRNDRILYRIARANGFATSSELLRH